MDTLGNDQSVGIAHVIHNFNGESKDEMSVKRGSQIKVINYVNEEWIRCYDPMSDCIGIVPISFVHIYVEDEGEYSTFHSSSSSSTPFSLNNIPPLTLPISPTRLSDDVWNIEWEDGNSVKSKKEKKPPPRPGPPSKEAIETLKEKRKNNEKEGIKDVSPMRLDNGRERALFVIDELVSSENAYIADIMSFVTAVNDSRMNKSDSEMLREMMGPLVQLSMSLHQSLTIQKGLDNTSELYVGRVFLEYRKSFSQVYSFYFRQLESAYNIIERPDNEEIMKEIMVCMRNTLPDTSCIEITSTLMRPIQRCLKYPLLLNELVKTLPLNHNDHPKLIEALKQMSNLASKMNESRRRRELVNKYSNESKKSIGDRISTMNVHSIQKKSSRFTARSLHRMGFIDLPKDSTMDNLLSKLYKLERTHVHFIYYLTVHMKKVHNFLVNEKALKELCTTLNSESIKKTALVAHNWLMNVNLNVRFVVERALREIPKKLIQKREDKLLDYYNALKNSAASVSDKKKEYEALSVQLRQKIPSIINSMTRSLQHAWIVLTDLHDICEGALYDLINIETGVKGDRKTPICRASLEKMRSITAMTTNDFGKELKEASEIKDGGVNQTAEDRMNVWSKMSTNAFKNGAGVFRVNAEWPGLRQPRDDLVCSIGDLVYVEHSTKKNDLWECWNGKKKGCIDGTLLSFVSIAQMERPQSTPLVHNHNIPNPTSVTLLDLDCPTQCSIPVIQANNLARVPSLPSISSSDPFDEFSSLRVSRRHLSPSLSQSIHPFLIPTVSSSHTTLHTVPHYPVSSISSIPHDPSVTLSLSTNVLQPLRINRHSSQSVQLSSTNPFRDLCDSHQS